VVAAREGDDEGGEGPLGAEFKELFRGSKVEIELVGDFKTAAWRKLCTNAAGRSTR